MSIENLNNSHEYLNNIRTNICIVGAGVAGLLMARRIARAGHDVVVLESGNAAFDDEIHQLNEIEDPGARYSRAMTGRYRGLGGSSSRWGGRMIPISAHDTESRDHVAQSQWPLRLDELDAYQSEIEQLFSTGHDSYEAIPANWRNRGAAFPIVDKTLTPRWAKCPTFKRCNVATLLAGELKTLPGLDIRLGATVCDFELDRSAGRLVALTARGLSGKTLTVRADRFVLAAGTIETTRLLLLLDAAADGHAFRRCNVLGRYFQDHLKADVATIGRGDPFTTNRLFGYRFVNAVRRDLHLELSHAAQQDDGVASAFAYIAMDIGQSPLADVKRLAQGIQRRDVKLADVGRIARNTGLVARAAWWRLVRNQLFVPASVDLRIMVCVEQLPFWGNRIFLGETRDRFDKPKARFDWRPTDVDERTFRSAVAQLAAYWKGAGFDSICPLDWKPMTQQGNAPVIDRAEACAHPSGSTRMGTDAATSVVGPDLYCHAVPNVAALSASVFPTAGSANPTFTIMKLALWLADSYLGAAAAPAPVVVDAQSLTQPLQFPVEVPAVS